MSFGIIVAHHWAQPIALDPPPPPALDAAVLASRPAPLALELRVDAVGELPRGLPRALGSALAAALPAPRPGVSATSRLRTSARFALKCAPPAAAFCAAAW